MNVGSLCSGIEAASVAWEPIGFEFSWFSEIDEYPSSVLEQKYPTVTNLGDMCDVPEMILNESIEAPDLICSGTPCQAFSLTGYREGLDDDRGQLTMKFVEIIDANDQVRHNRGNSSTIFFWENVEGVLSDKTNAFGIMISALAGIDKIISKTKWPNAGIIKGPKRNIAWRVLDAKYFGVPQQRKRIYLLGGGKDFNPELILFEKSNQIKHNFPKNDLKFTKDGIEFEIFREYTDCLYAAYGTKWNGNAAAYNGSLFVSENSKLRRLTISECEALMGFPKGYTALKNIKKRDLTSRYKAVGNSWAVPVIKWIGERIKGYHTLERWSISRDTIKEYELYLFDKSFSVTYDLTINCSECPETPIFSDMKHIVEKCEYDQLYLSPTACHGILRRATERSVKINPRLKEIMEGIASSVPIEEIERKSRIQPRGEYSLRMENDSSSRSQKNYYKLKDSIGVAPNLIQTTLFD